MFWDAYPRFNRRIELALRVGGFGVRLLTLMSRDEGVAVNRLGGFHGSRAAAQLLKHGGFPIFIFHVVALEDDTTFHLATRVVGRQLTVLLDADLKDAANMNFSAGSFMRERKLS